MGVDVSIGISPRERFSTWMDLAGELEQRGVDRIWLVDSQMAMKDVYAGLLTAAITTERVELGTGVTNLLTRDPTVTASAIAAVAEVSNGRALLGLGAGDSAVRALGRRPSRISELEDGLRLLRALLNGEEARWSGRTVRLPNPAESVKLHLAVSRPRMCRLAGELADGAIIMGAAQPDLLREQLRQIDEGRAASGRDRAEVELSFVVATAIDEDPARATRRVRSWASAQARLLADVEALPPSLAPYRQELAKARSSYDFREHLSTRAHHQTVVSDGLVEKLAVVGTEEQCAARLRDLRDTGIDRLIFPLMPPGRVRMLEAIQRLVERAPV